MIYSNSYYPNSQTPQNYVPMYPQYHPSQYQQISGVANPIPPQTRQLHVNPDQSNRFSARQPGTQSPTGSTAASATQAADANLRRPGPDQKPNQNKSAQNQDADPYGYPSYQPPQYQNVMQQPISFPIQKLSINVLLPLELYNVLVQLYLSIRIKKYATSAINPLRNYLTVYEYSINDQWIIWDYETGFVHLTGMWKAAEIATLKHLNQQGPQKSKADIIKLLDSTPKEYHDYIKRIRGGFLKIQGTWLPYTLCKILARRFCYYIRFELIPIFGNDFPDYCLPPYSSKFGELKFDDVESELQATRFDVVEALKCLQSLSGSSTNTADSTPSSSNPQEKTPLVRAAPVFQKPTNTPPIQTSFPTHSSHSSISSSHRKTSSFNLDSGYLFEGKYENRSDHLEPTSPKSNPSPHLLRSPLQFSHSRSRSLDKPFDVPRPRDSCGTPYLQSPQSIYTPQTPNYVTSHGYFEESGKRKVPDGLQSLLAAADLTENPPAKERREDEIPQPQPSLAIPIPTNLEILGKRIPNLNNFKSLLNLDEKLEAEQTEIKEDKTSQRYAQLSLDLVDTDPETDKLPASSYNLSDKLFKVLNTSVDDKLVKEIFNLDLNENSLIDSSVTGSLARKKLRSKVESGLIKNQSSFLKDYAPMVKQFKQMESKIDKLNELNQINTKKIQEIFLEIMEFNKEFKALNSEKSMVNLKKNLLINFKKKFLLNEYEEFTISNSEINSEFFLTLVKLDSINERSAILLSIDNSNLGINIMQKTTKLIEKSNQTLANFIKRSLIHPVWTNSKEKLTNFQYCVKFLRSRNPDLFDTVLQEFANDRSKLLIEDFNKQIDILNHHDAVRFIGDLLAYVHAMVVNEIELMNSIFKVNKAELGDVITEEDVGFFDECIETLLNKIFEKLSKSIKSHLEQLISIELKFKVVYSIFNLFDLYKLMFEKNFTGSNVLIKTVTELIEFSQSRIIDLVRNTLKSIKSSNLAQLDLNSDLQPPEWIIDFCSNILPIIEQSKAMFDSIFNMNDEDAAEFMNTVVDEPIEILDQHMKVKDFTPLEKIILKLNFVDLILSKILPISLFNDKIIELNSLMDNLKKKASDLQYDLLLKSCKLYDIQNIISMILPFEDAFFDVSIYEPVTENKLFSAQYIDEANKAIAEYLPNALIEIQNNFLKLNNPLASSDIIDTCSLTFVKFYLKLNLLTNHYLQKKMIWTDYEVATLLGIEDFYSQEKQNIVLD